MGNNVEKHESKCTSIYWGNDPADHYKLKPVVRLTPTFMGLEATGFPHGIGMEGYFETHAQAVAFAKRVDAFMDEMMQDILDGEAHE